MWVAPWFEVKATAAAVPTGHDHRVAPDDSASSVEDEPEGSAHGVAAHADRGSASGGHP